MNSGWFGQIDWEYPWLLVAGIGAAAVAILLLLRTASPLPAWRRALGGGGLALCVVTALLAAAGVFWRAQGEGRTVWVLVDRSLSVGESAEARLSAVLRDLSTSLGPQDYIGVIGFSDNAEVLLPPQPARLVNADLRLQRGESADETWLQGALELAAQHKVADTEAIALLLGDGHDSTLRYGIDLQREARNASVRLLALPVDSSPLPEAAIADLSARLAGDGTRLAIDLVVFSTVAQTVTPQVKLNGEAVNALTTAGQPAGPVHVEAGRTPIRLVVPLQMVLATYVVEVALAAPQNSYPRNDSLKLVVRGPGESRVLIAHADGEPQRALARALAGAGLQVTMGGPGIMPSEATELAKYQAVMLCDVPATSLTPAQMELLARFTRDGGGLAMLGGPRGFAPGGYYETAIERVLPVTCQVVEKGREQSPALLIVLDRSGSMRAEVGGRTKMDLANEGCVRAIQLAAPGSRFGMLAVDTQPHWVVALEVLRDRALATDLARGNTVGGGGILTRTAMVEALRAMRALNATSKHIVLFSDGSDTEEQDGVIDMVRAAHENDRITVSTICLGRGSDWPFLSDLAVAGGGRSFLVEDASQLPAVFSREAALSGGNFLREQEFRPWHGAPGSLTDGVDFRAESSPPLLGYVAATARDAAHVWLWADEDKERPLLATWHVELGRAMAFTSDARDRWADRWLPWDRYNELWQRWVRWLLPQPEIVQGVEPEWSLAYGGPALTLRFFDDAGNPRELRSPVCELTLPDGSAETGTVLPIGSGTYRIQFSRAGAGMYAASVREKTPGGEDKLAAREHQVFVPLDEMLRRPADRAALGAVARATGGAVVSAAGEVARFEARGAMETVSPRGWLLWLAATGLLLGIAGRRLPSVWRARDSEAQRRTEEVRVLTARDAFERVRQTLAQRQQPPSSSTPRAPAVAPRPAAVAAPAAPAQPAAPGEQGSLLSAVRRVRKQMEDRGPQQ